MSKSNIVISMVALGSVLSTGCVMNQMVEKQEKVVINRGKEQKTIDYTYASYEPEYTILGNGVNLLSGTTTGFVNYGITGAKRNYTETTNGIPVIWPAMKAGYGFITNASIGAIEGGYEGWNIPYAEVQELNKEQNQKIGEFLNKAQRTIMFERDD